MTPTRTSASSRQRTRAALARSRSGRRSARTDALATVEMVERHLALAQHLAERVDSAPELERLADVPLNIVCFRARPPNVPEEQLDELNSRLGAAILADGRVFVGTTTYAGKTALRPAIVNWQTQVEDIDLLVDVTCQLTRAEVALSGSHLRDP